VGAEVVLSKMDMAFLKEMAEAQKVDVYDVTSQPTVIEAILTGKVLRSSLSPLRPSSRIALFSPNSLSIKVPAKRARVEPKKEPISKKKPKLEAGITITDMMQHYNLSELQVRIFCSPFPIPLLFGLFLASITRSLRVSLFWFTFANFVFIYYFSFFLLLAGLRP
jgi:hypothetical protein